MTRIHSLMGFPRSIGWRQRAVTGAPSVDHRDRPRRRTAAMGRRGRLAHDGGACSSTASRSSGGQALEALRQPAGRRPGGDRAGTPPRQSPAPVHARGRHRPLSVRLCGGGIPLPLRRRAGHGAPPPAAQRTPARPHRPAGRPPADLAHDLRDPPLIELRTGSRTGRPLPRRQAARLAAEGVTVDAHIDGACCGGSQARREGEDMLRTGTPGGPR